MKIAVLIPCHNEEIAITKVVGDFQLMLPDAAIYVYDNNSNDETMARARAAGAIVRSELLQGKGQVVRRMFADVEADLYVLVDGDDTYDACSARQMIDLLIGEQLDMVTGVRKIETEQAYRVGHQLGNVVLTGTVRCIFGARITDMLSGYRVFSRRFVKSFPALATGFETETEFTVHALQLRLPLGELPTSYGARPEGSQSKLHTIRDGLRILSTIIGLIKEERPLQFFGAIALLLMTISLVFGIPVVIDFMQSGLVPRLPTAVLSASLVVLSSLLMVCGLILDSVANGRREMKRLAYLALSAFRID
jgi:glycosyltransferase involved in cell wall biosynthesis